MTLIAAGRLMALGGTVAATRPIQDAFGLIRVPGIEGVHGSANGLEVGTTNIRGDLPVPSLLPYYGKRLAIAGRDLPEDMNVDAAERVVAPALRGGAAIRFAARQSRAATGIVLIEEAGRTRPPSASSGSPSRGSRSNHPSASRGNSTWRTSLPVATRP